MGKTLPEAAVIRSLLQAVFPELCLHCGERIPQNDFLCLNCAGAGILQRAIESEAENGFGRRFSFLYDGPAKTLFAAAKFSERRRALRFFIHAAKDDLLELDGKDVVFLALPSRKKFLRRLLTGSLPEAEIIFDAFRFKTHLMTDAANKSLGESGRYRRIHDSLQWNNPQLPPAEKYVICDDVSTTGATLGHAAHLLRQNLKLQNTQITLWALMYRERHFRIPRQ